MLVYNKRSCVISSSGIKLLSSLLVWCVCIQGDYVSVLWNILSPICSRRNLSVLTTRHIDAKKCFLRHSYPLISWCLSCKWHACASLSSCIMMLICTATYEQNDITSQADLEHPASSDPSCFASHVTFTNYTKQLRSTVNISMSRRTLSHPCLNIRVYFYILCSYGS